MWLPQSRSFSLCACDSIKHSNNILIYATWLVKIKHRYALADRSVPTQLQTGERSSFISVASWTCWKYNEMGIIYLTPQAWVLYSQRYHREAFRYWFESLDEHLSHRHTPVYVDYTCPVRGSMVDMVLQPLLSVCKKALPMSIKNDKWSVGWIGIGKSRYLVQGTRCDRVEHTETACWSRAGFIAFI